jgi:adenylosuccinate synthase
MPSKVIIGLQWGDEGKGKVVDNLVHQWADVCVRYQGGPNAGHTIYDIDGNKHVTHALPSGVLKKDCINIIAKGCVVEPFSLYSELMEYPTAKLSISDQCPLILPHHIIWDRFKYQGKIGTTAKGIGPAYMDKTGRNGLRIGDILADDFEARYNRLKEKHLQLLNQYDQVVDWQAWEEDFFKAVHYLKELQIINAEYWLNNQLKQGKKVLAEGAQGSMLDIDFGTYPFVTSSNTISAGVCNGLGVAPTKIKDIFGITKAYCTRVGGGPFPTELMDELGEAIRKEGGEFGATTGRPRRCGWIDLVALKYAVMLSGVTKLIVTKADILDAFKPVEVCVAYDVNGTVTEDFPYDVCNATIKPVYKQFPGWENPTSKSTTQENLDPAFITYCNFIEQFIETKIEYISNGPGRDQLIHLK